MNTPEPTPMKPHFTRQIEEINLTGSPEPRRPQKHHFHFDLEIYVLNHQQSRKNSTTIWHRDADGSFRAEEYEDLLTYLRARRVYLHSNDRVDSESAEEVWKQWLESDDHPAVQAFLDHNDKPSEVKILNEALKHLHTGESAVEDAWSELNHIRENILLAFYPSGRYNDDRLFRETKKILSNLASNLRAIESAHAQVIDKLGEADTAVKSLIEAKTAAEKYKSRKRSAGLETVNTVKFVKGCLENHCNLVNIVLGQPDPLVQQGTDLMQLILSELSGVHDDPKEGTDDGQDSAMSESEENQMSELEQDQASESDEDAEYRHNSKRQKRDQQSPVTQPEKRQTRQTKLVLGRVEKSRRISYRRKPEQSASPSHEPDSDCEGPNPLSGSPRRSMRLRNLNVSTFKGFRTR
ncbi:hypothetical protein D6D10_06061 [Aureobasidium pullulans]|uniref:Uncharacterized protein n=1 Tax=Aureobasidium pullulans TaxID=5580 RepID=A0A4S9ER21_AURPU|nr:hypothetical protein D6D10_06061 [Aureobasidium pullulans]